MKHSKIKQASQYAWSNEALAIFLVKVTQNQEILWQELQEIKTILKAKQGGGK